VKLTLEQFTGMIPRRHPRLLPNTASELAENTKLWSGKIKPWRANSNICNPFQTLPRSIYLFAKNALPPGYFFQFAESEVDAVKGQVGGDTTERTYFTGGPQGRPQVTDKYIGVRGQEEEWETIQHYTTGNIVVGTATSGVYFECTTPGTAGVSEPTWDITPPNTTADGTVVWTARALTASTQCSDLPDNSVNLGIPAPVDAPTAERHVLDGLIAGFTTYQGSQNTGSGGRNQTFEVLGNATVLTMNMDVTVRLILAGDYDQGPARVITYNLWRDTAAVNPVDSESVSELGWHKFTLPEPGINEQGEIIHKVTLTETVSLPVGAHFYSVNFVNEDFRYSASVVGETISWTAEYGVTGTPGTGVIIDLGTLSEAYPFEVGSTVRLSGIVGAANSNFEELNGDHEVIAVGSNSVTIVVGPLDPADYVSGGTWQFIPNELGTFDRFYVYTYVARMGTLLQEGPPSPVSSVFGLLEDSEVSILDMSVPPAGFNISRIRIYRTVTGNDTTEFRFVNEISATNTTYEDVIPEGSTNIGEVLLSEDWGPPPIDLHSIVQMPNGIMVGLSKNEVYLAEAFQPHAWPDEYRQSMNFNGVSTGVFGNTVLITTNGNPYLLTGNSPGEMSMDKLELSQSCSSKRSTVDMGYSVLYASPDGIVQVGPGIARLVSEPLFTKDEWGVLNPSSMIAARWDDRYVVFFTKTNGERGGFVFDPKNAEASYTELNIIAEAAFTEPDDAKLYLVDASNDIVEFDADMDEDLDFTWRSKRFHLPRPVNLGAGMVHAESYPVGFSLLSTEKKLTGGDDDQMVERFTKSVIDNQPFRLPAGYTSDEFQVELTGSVVVEGVYVAETLRELNLV